MILLVDRMSGYEKSPRCANSRGTTEGKFRMTNDSNTSRRTKRRYAHELYPHAEEWETRALEVEVPYLYSRAIGFDVGGTGWFSKAEPTEMATRTHHLLDARLIALMADAMLQGLAGRTPGPGHMNA